MVDRSASRAPLYGVAALGAAVVLVWTQVMTSVHRVSPPLAIGSIVADLVLFLPLLWYAFVVRRQLASPRSTFVVAAIGLASARWLAPEPSPILTGAFFALQGSVLAFVALGAARAYRERKDVRSVFRALVPARVAAIADTERALLLSAFGRTHEAPAQLRWANLELWRGQVIALSMLVVVEATVVHLLLMDVWPRGVWVITGVELYALVFLVGDARALGRTGLDVSGETLRVRFGLRWSVEVPLARVASIEPVIDDKAFDAKMALQDAPDLVITFDRPVTMQGAYGFTRSVRRLGLRVEHPEAVKQALGGA
ncbi:MAG: hypothetical protein RIT81_43085 [Deltaproteobacteria bacterium]